MSSTARLADYVVACKQTLETPGMSQSGEAIKYFGTGIGFSDAYAQYSPAVADVPRGSDLVEEWDFFYQMADYLDLELTFAIAFGFSRYQESPYAVMPVSRSSKPTMEDFYEAICANSRIPLRRSRNIPTARFLIVMSLYNQERRGVMTGWSAAMAICLTNSLRYIRQDYRALQNTPDFPYRYIPRRHNNFMNSSGRSIAKLNGGRPWNPVWIHPGRYVRNRRCSG